MAHEFGVDIDMHLDFGPTADGMDVDHVCRRTDQYKYGGRLAIGPVTKATSLPMDKLEAMAKRLAGAAAPLTVLPSPHPFLMGRHHQHHHNSTRAVLPPHNL